MEDEHSVEDEQREKRMIDKRKRRRLQEEKRKVASSWRCLLIFCMKLVNFRILMKFNHRVSPW